MRIAVLTFYRSRNCGAMLQAFAMKTVLENLGHAVSFPKCCGKKYGRWEPIFNKRLKGWKGVKHAFNQVLLNALSIGFNRESPRLYEAFAAKWFRESNCIPAKFDSEFDAVVVGSDQVWSPRLTGKRWSVYTCKSVPESVRIISYAASCGDAVPKGRQFAGLAERVRRFSAVSVRETFLQKFLSSQWKIPAVCVLDPSLLLEARDYEKAISTDLVPGEPYVLVFYVRSSVFPCRIARELEKTLKMKVVLAPGRLRSRLGKPKDALLGLSPDRFLGLFANARAVVASSFHATAFSLIFRKPFVALQNGKDGLNSRSGSLLTALGIQERFIMRAEDGSRAAKLLTEQIPESAYEKFEALRDESMTWLRTALAG